MGAGNAAVTAPRSPIDRVAVASYGAGSLGTGIFSTVPSVLLLYYGTETLGLSGTVLAAIILANKFWSIVWDPYVGAWSDGSRAKSGRRRPFMIVGAIGTAAAFALLFGGPPLGPAALVAWVSLTYFALATFYSLFAVPYSAVPAEIACDSHDAARLVSGRMTFVMIGVLAGAAFAPMIVAAGGGGRPGYAAMGVALGLASLAAMIPPIVMLRSLDRGDGGPSRLPRAAEIMDGLLDVAANARFRRLALAFLAQAIGFGSTSAALPYAITTGLRRPESDIGLAFAVYLVTTIIAVPLWTMLARRIGLARGIALAAIGFAAGSAAIGVVIGAEASWSIGLAVLAVAGIPFAGLQVLPFTAAADVVRAEAPAREARFAGVWTATEKLGLALGAAAFGVTLDVAGTSGPAVAGFLALFPTGLCLLSLYWLRLPCARQAEGADG